MSKSLSNAIYGALDYLCYPAGMLLLAPVVLHRAGPAQYGLWMVATSIISATAIIASGLCDAAIQQIAVLRSTPTSQPVEQCLRTLSALTLSLAFLSCLLLCLTAPYLALRLSAHSSLPASECATALRLAAINALLRTAEAIPVSAQRAYESYGPSVRINLFVRFATLSLAALIAAYGGHATHILACSAVVMALGLALQCRALSHMVSLRGLLPSFSLPHARALLGSGVFVWAQAAASVVFRQCDRILLGLSLGAAAVVPYALSVQLSEPLFGLTASTLSFFFPYLSCRAASLQPSALRALLARAFLGNLLIVSTGTALLLASGPFILRHWAGAHAASQASGLLPLITMGSALSGLSVVGVYAAQALGLFRLTATVSIASRAALFACMLLLLHRQGAHGLAVARLFHGFASLLVYLPLARRFHPGPSVLTPHSGLLLATTVHQGEQP